MQKNYRVLLADSRKTKLCKSDSRIKNPLLQRKISRDIQATWQWWRQPGQSSTCELKGYSWGKASSVKTA